jgi:DNA (cytosine-5)-methyltransferase 1
MFNQGVNAQYEPQITDDGVAASMVARGPAAVAFAGNRTSGPLDVATSCLANGSPHGRMDFASETFVVGEPTGVFPCIDANVDSKWGSNQWVDGGQYVLQGKAMAVRTAQTSANGHGVAEEVAHTLDQVQGQAVAVDLQNVAIGGDVAGTLDTTRPSRGGGQAVATPIDLRQAARGEKVTNNRSSGSGGPPGSGVGVPGDPAFTVSERGQAVAFKPGQSEAAGGTFVTEEFAPTIQSQNNGSTAVPAVAFKPSHFTRGKDGKPDEIAPPLSADADKGDQDTVIMRQSIGFNWQNGGGYGNANDGLGITEEGTGPLSRSQVPACVTGQRTHALTTRAAAVEEDGTGRGTPIVPVAFSAKDSGSDATEELSPTMRAMQHVDGNANAGGQIAVAYGVDTYNQTVSDVSIPLRVGNAKDSLPAAMVPFTKAKRAQSVNDDESWVPGEVAPTQNQFDVGDTRATTVVAFTQNSRDEVRQIDGDGQIAGALSAEMGMHQTNYLAFSPLQGGRSMPVTPESPTLEAGTGNKAPAVLAFANRTRDGVKVPEIMKDGVTPALTNPGDGGRADAVNVLADAPVQVQWASGGGKVENPTMQALRTSAEHSYQFVRQAMQVRRLTPTECCRLQGFPDEHCDITFRKKPAADGPKYRALGNSMAVPCMAWLGYRIHLATRQDGK